MSNFHKIDPALLYGVSKQESCEEVFNCVVYTKDFQYFKKQFVSTIKKEVLEFPFIQAFGLELSKNEILQFADYSVVTYITKQASVFAQIDVAKQIMNVEAICENRFYGSGVTIAVIDTGISNHLDFCLPHKRIIKFVDLISHKGKPYDDNGHGTFVASIACGNGFSSGGRYAGVCPMANIISIKALEKNGETGTFKILEAMQWVYDHKKEYNIKVVCMSFGSTPVAYNDPMMLGAEALWNEGIVVVAAAGNAGPEMNTIKSPGVSGKIITVGGFNDKRNAKGEYKPSEFEIAEFSSRGPAGYFFKPDIVAPAVNIMGARVNGGYISMSGTSVATPMIAGVSALICEKYPTIQPNKVKKMLLGNCAKLTNNRNADGQGYLKLSNFKIW